MKRPKIEYPCKWEYCVIGKEEAPLRQAVSEALKGADYNLSFSRSSKSGKYISLELTTTVANEEARDRIHGSLRAHPTVKIVM